NAVSGHNDHRIEKPWRSSLPQAWSTGSPSTRHRTDEEPHTDPSHESRRPLCPIRVLLLLAMACANHLTEQYDPPRGPQVSKNVRDLKLRARFYLREPRT